MATAPADADALGSKRCESCGTELAPNALACPRCGRLVHGEALRKLAADAERATRDADPGRAICVWREALELLPRSSRQHTEIAGRIAALGAAAGAKATAPAPKLGGGLAAAGALGLLAWKLKALLLFVATKGKLLLLGFGKGGTLLSMFASLGLYASLWGWKLALGLILSIYVHEIGHVAALRALGIKATAPMFVPGLGAFVRSKQYPASPREDAQVGLAGPIWGLGAAVAAWLLGSLTGHPVMLAVARLGAWINLFNLMPLGSLDGGRGFRALTRRQRLLACAAIGGGLLLSGDGLLLLLLGVAGVRAFVGAAPAEGDRAALVRYSGLVLALSALCGISVLAPP